MTLHNGALMAVNAFSGKLNERTVAGNTAVLNTDDVIFVNAAAGAIQVTFVPDVTNAGHQVKIIKIDGTNNAVSIFNGVAVVGGMDSSAAGVNYASVVVLSTGAALALT